MKALRYIILALFVMNIPSGALMYVGGLLGTLLSYGSYALLLLYYIRVKKGPFNKWMLVIGIIYFSLSSLQFYGSPSVIVLIACKYLVLIIGGYEVIKRTSHGEFLFFLVFGALTILLHAAFLGGGSAEYGRYSGFYINPNAGGFISISGYALAYAIKNKKLRLIAQIVCTCMGLLTLSRTFIALWVMINFLSLKIDIKNIRIFVYGFGLASLLLVVSEFLPVKNPRIEQLKTVLKGEEVNVQEINEDSRTETWSTYFAKISENVIIGSGFKSFTIKDHQRNLVGIHNTFLLVLGEAGFIPFIMIVIFYIYILIYAIRLFNHHPNILMQSIALFFFLMASHVYFTHAFILFISMYIQNQIESHRYLLNPNQEQNYVEAA